MASKDLYGDDRDRLVQILEDGLEQTGGNERIRELLIDTYLDIAAEQVEDKQFEDALKTFDRLLEFARKNKKVLDGLADCLNLYIEELMEAKKYEEISAFLDIVGIANIAVLISAVQ